MLRLLHIALFLAGAFAFYLGAFAYNQGLRIGNKLDDWWGRQSGAPNDVWSLVYSFFAAVSGTVELRLIACFMEEEFSVQWIVLCATLPLVSFIWTLGILLAAANVHHPDKWIQAALNEDSRNALIFAFALLPIAFAVAFIFKFFLVLVAGVIGAIIGAVEFTRRTVASMVRGDFTIHLPSERLAGMWSSMRNAPASWKLPAGLKAWVIALHGFGVRLMAVYTLVCMAIAIPAGILLVLALTLPLIAVWFGGLGWIELKILSPDFIKVSKPIIAAVIAAGVLPAASCLFTLRWNLSRCFAVRHQDPRRTLSLTLAVLLLSSFLCFGPFLAVHHFGLSNRPGKFPIAAASMFVALCNGFNVLIGFILIGAALLLIIHLRIWRRLRHWLMALRLAGIPFSRKFYVAAGLLLFVTYGGGWNLWHTLITRPEIYEKFAGVLERIAGWF